MGMGDHIQSGRYIYGMGSIEAIFCKKGKMANLVVDYQCIEIISNMMGKIIDRHSVLKSLEWFR